MRKLLFEEFLQEKFNKQYNWSDDNAPDAFDNWLCNLTDDEYNDYKDDWKYFNNI